MRETEREGGEKNTRTASTVEKEKGPEGKTGTEECGLDLAAENIIRVHARAVLGKWCKQKQTDHRGGKALSRQLRSERGWRDGTAAKSILSLPGDPASISSTHAAAHSCL